MQDKKSTIFRFIKEPLTYLNKKVRSKVNIWLNIALYSVKLVFFYIAIISPITVQAGVFSFISDFFEGKEADAGTRYMTSQTMAVLQANLGPSSTSPVGGGEITIVDDSALYQEAGVIGTQADLVEPKSTQISLYVVRPGDTLSEIANLYEVSINTIIWANNIKGPIHEGDELVILPISGVNHIVKKGETIKSIAAKYKADVNDILGYNNVSLNQTLSIGSTLIIPDGEVQSSPITSSKTVSKLRGAGGPLYADYYMRPIDGGRKSQGLHGYNGVDLAAPIGTPIHASAAGIVIIARSSGYNGGYGSYVVISHANGTQTLYGHMNTVLVSQGEAVDKGETIGTLGNSGKSTGPHVHFEVRGAANPF